MTRGPRFLPVIGLALVAASVRGQAPTGIQFEKQLDWQQVQAKARAEHKLIFIDAYATWCVPCRVMDQTIYPQPQVGDFMNAHFISVKVQYDQTPKDSGQALVWRPQVKAFEAQYPIGGYPSFLFFTADGHAVHQSIGLMSAPEFIALAQRALDPAQQYFTLRAAYRAGQRDVNAMSTLAVEARDINDTAVAYGVARELNQQMLPKLGDAALYTKPILTFLRDFMPDGNARAFTLFYQHAATVDSVLGYAGAAQHTTDRVIINEEIAPKIWAKGVTTPDWSGLNASIAQKYDAVTADRTILTAKIWWATQHHVYADMVRYNAEKFDRYGVDTANGNAAQVNQVVWEVIFEHATDPTVLSKAVKWMDLVIAASPGDGNILDTQANLLYKLGRRDDAIAEETRAVAMGHNDPSLVANLTKMKQGQPTWETDTPHARTGS